MVELKPLTAQALFQALARKPIEGIRILLNPDSLHISVPCDALRELKMAMDFEFEKAHEHYKLVQRQVEIVTDLEEMSNKDSF